MHNYIFIITLVAFSLCSGCSKKENVVIQLNNVKITKQEFQKAYQESPYSKDGSAGLKTFLDQYITKKVILIEAERQGLDKNPSFLADLQQYWEQGLIKSTLARANQQVRIAPITNQEAEDYYNKKGQELFAGKAFAEVSEQIKEFLLLQHKRQALSLWLEGLKQEIKITVDYKDIGF